MFRTVLAALLAIVFCGGSASGEIIYYEEGLSSNLYRFDTSTATNSFIGNMGVGISWGFAFSPTGTLYGINVDNGNLYTINTSTAALTLFPSSSAAKLAIDSGRVHTKTKSPALEASEASACRVCTTCPKGAILAPSAVPSSSGARR